MQNSNEQVSFEQFANFDFKEETPNLPFKNTGVVNEQTDMYIGGFATTVEIDEDNVAKITRALSLNRKDLGKKPYIFEEKQYPDTLESLADYVSTPDKPNKERIANVDASVDKLLSISGIRRDTYENIRAIMGNHVAELKLTTIVESPRKILEKVDNKNKLEELKENSIEDYEELLKKIPSSEITITEIWENVGVKNSLDKKSQEELRELHKDPKYLEEQKDFAEKAYVLLMNRGIILDLCDKGGIKVKVDGGKELMSEKTVEGTLDIMKNPADLPNTPVCRNVAYKNNSIIYYDIYPTWEISTKYLDENYLKNIMEAIESSDKVKIFELIGVESDKDLTDNETLSDLQKNRRLVFQYLALLKSMGLESFKVDNYDLESYEPTYEQKARLSLITGILSECEKKEIDLSVMGGYGMDGLYGKLTRPHEDLDLLVEDSHVENFDRILTQKGFLKDKDIEGKYVYANPQYPKFKIEFGLLSQGLAITKTLNTQDLMPNEPNASINGVHFKAPNINAVKEIVRVQNERASAGNWGSYRIDKRRNMEALMKYLDEKV